MVVRLDPSQFAHQLTLGIQQMTVLLKIHDNHALRLIRFLLIHNRTLSLFHRFETLSH